MRFALMPPSGRPSASVSSSSTAAYVINYNLGLDLVRAHIEAAGDSPEARWAAFAELLSSPRLPSSLAPD